jgi:hypothetical protein
MAVLTSKGLSGQLGEVVVKQYADKTVVTVKPDGGRKKRSNELQVLYQDCFKRGQRRACMDKRNKELLEQCRLYMKKGQALYHFLMEVYPRQEIRKMERGLERLESLEVILKEEFGGRVKQKAVLPSPVVCLHPPPVVLNHGDTAAQRGTGEIRVVLQTVSYGGWVSTSTGVREREMVGVITERVVKENVLVDEQEGVPQTSSTVNKGVVVAERVETQTYADAEAGLPSTRGMGAVQDLGFQRGSGYKRVRRKYRMFDLSAINKDVGKIERQRSEQWDDFVAAGKEEILIYGYTFSSS